MDLRIAATVAVVFTNAIATASTINVPAQQPTIQAGINAAIDGDTVLVAPGLYLPGEDIRIDNKNITLASSGGPDLTTIDISGGTLSITGSSSSTLDGFTLIATSSTLFNATTTGVNSITNCKFAPEVGGVDGVRQSGGTLSVTDCRFEGLGNAAVTSNGSIATFLRCYFADNERALQVANSGVDIIESRFYRNSAGNNGAALSIGPNATATVTASEFIDNTSLPFGSGGAIYVEGILTARNSLFDHNQAFFGGAIFFQPASLQLHQLIVNCTIVNNVADGNVGGILIANNTSITVVNSILWDNFPNEIAADLFTATRIVYNTVKGDYPGVGNRSGVPGFINGYHLQDGSASIDSGHNWYALATPLDLDGNPRFADNPLETEHGCGVPVIVDHGAYEFQGNPANVKFIDLDGDQAIGVPDLLAMLAAWGQLSSNGCQLADLDLDNIVGVPDLLTLLANWGL